MFKIRKRTPTNVGMATIQDAAPPGPAPRAARASSKNDVPSSLSDSPSGPNSERQWMVRLENGETKTCRELATLQQWIVAGIVTRESLISRSGKTWKRLGDIAELGQYFVIADEARAQRAAKPTNPKPMAPTMLGTGAPAATGGSTEPEDDLEGRSTGNYRARPRTTPPPPPPAKGVNPLAQTEISAQIPVPRRAPTQPPPPPKVPDGRQTAAWASSEVKHSESMAAMPQGPRGGRLSAIPGNEPAFSGKIRMTPGDEASFDTGRVRSVDDDDDLIAPQRGSRAGMWIALLALLVIGGAAGVVYVFVFNKKGTQANAPGLDAAAVAQVADAAVAPPPPAIDAAVAPPPAADPLDGAKTELSGDVEARMKGAADAIASKDDAASLAMRARLATAIAQSMNDRAGLADKAEGDKLRKDARQLVIDAAPLAQKALKAAADDPSANLAMADVLRLQGKPARDVARYLDKARAKAADDKQLARSIALCEALMKTSAGDQAKALGAIDAAGDTRVLFAQALAAYVQHKTADAKPIVEQILAASSDHDGARALSKKLETAVASTDPLPPEDSGSSKGPATKPPVEAPVANDYDSLLARANKLAETNCSKATEVFGKALEQKPTGVEALTGLGYCYLDAKQFASAFSKFRAALAVSSRYEPALGGVAETYQRQGNKEQAIQAWHHYLDVYPDSPKAKKQLEILGDTGGEKPAPPPGGGDQAPQPAQGSGSAS
jgi:Flp pilus assembly protein TadD